MKLEKVLIVDDDLDFAKMCKEQLLGIESVKEVDIIESGVAFFKQFMSKEYSLVILDYILRDIDGLQILIEMNDKGIRLPVIMMTGQGDESVVVDCYQRGVIDYIIKDFGIIKNLKDRIIADFEKYNAQEIKDKEFVQLKENNEILNRQIKEISENVGSIKKENNILKNEIKTLKEKIKKDRNINESAIQALSYALDKSHAGSLDKTADFLSQALAVGKELNLSDDELEKLRTTALLLNIGAAGIEQSDLIIEQEMNDEQQIRLKKICEGGADIINTQSKLSEIAGNVLYQFERWDGKGYPYGLKKDETPVTTRILQVIKVYNILVKKGYHNKQFTHEAALKLINERAGTFYDPNVVFAFSKIIKKIK
jgi:response regulator RpfG family c-di-GMP phosphodiesterase